MIGTFEASGLYGWICLVKLVSTLAARAHNLSSGPKLTTKYQTYKEYNDKADFGNDGDELHYVLSSMIGYDWYNNDGGRGELIWDLKKEKIFVDGYQYYQGEVECQETYFLDGKEPKTKYKES